MRGFMNRSWLIHKKPSFKPPGSEVLEHVFLQLYSYVWGGAVVKCWQFRQTQMATLKLLPTVLLAPLSSPPPLFSFPPFQILFFRRLVENNAGGGGRGAPSLRGKPGLLSICQLLEIINLRGEWNRCSRCCGVFGGVAVGGSDLRASPEQENGLNGWKTAVDDCLNKCFFPVSCSPLLFCEELQNEWRHIWCEGWGSQIWGVGG